MQRKSKNLKPIVFHLVAGQQLSLVIVAGVPLKNDTGGPKKSSFFYWIECCYFLSYVYVYIFKICIHIFNKQNACENAY